MVRREVIVKELGFRGNVVSQLMLSDQRIAIESAMKSLLSKYASPLFRIMEYQIGWVDEQAVPVDRPTEYPMLYSALCLASCQSTGGLTASMIPMAVALEFVDNFFQVHIDVQEGRQERYNRSTVWWIWGPGQAINVGDAFHALARLSIMSTPKNEDLSYDPLVAVQMIDTACLRMCQGINIDLTYQERLDVSVDSYLSMVRDKVGALMGCSMGLGSLYSPVPSETVYKLSQIGEEFGIISQICEDIQELWQARRSGYPVNSGLLNKRKTLPVAYVFEKGSIAQKRALGNIYFKRVLEPSDLLKIADILEDAGGKQYAEKMVERILNDIFLKIKGLGISEDGCLVIEKIANSLSTS